MRNVYSLKLFLFLTLASAFILPSFRILAEDANSDATSSEVSLTNLTPTEERKTLEEELKKLEEQIAKYETDITKTEQEKKTLQNQIYILKTKIEKLNLQIKQSNTMIKDLGLQIGDTEKSINNTSLKIEDSKAKLSELLRLIYEEDQKSFVEIMLSGKKLSDFFDNLMALESLNTKNQELLKEIKNLKSDLETQKTSLDDEKAQLEGVVKMQTLQKQESETTKKEKDSLLNLTEAQYQKILKEKEATQKRVSEIRARIFELIGIPEAPTFGEAYELAKEIESITGIRPAFLLAVLTQESNIGKNVGQCYLKDVKIGSGVTTKGKAVSNVMKPSRDVQPFLTITQELGRDPFNTLVSCPMSYGYGGAMGPAQFIPSTWMIYRDRIRGITGKAADPWNIKDSFLASALYLSNSGADQQTYNAEWKAAIIYFAGSANLQYRFYGDSVMKITAQYAEDIKAIEGTI